MGHALRNYESADPGDEVRTYGYLMAQANRQIALRRQRENGEAIKSRLSGKASHAAPATPGQQHCAQWVNKGSCKKGAKCNNRHDANRKGSPAASSSTVVPASSITAPAHADTKGKGKGKDKNGNPNAKGGGKGKDDYPPPRGASASSRPCFEFSKEKCSKADKCPFTHRKLTSEEKVERDEWARAKEAQAKGGEIIPLVPPARTLTLLVLPSSAASARRGRGVRNLHHIEAGDRQSVPSAPATSMANQTTGQAAVGPALADASGSGFVTSILRRAALAFMPAHDSGARGSASR